MGRDGPVRGTARAVTVPGSFGRSSGGVTVAAVHGRSGSAPSTFARGSSSSAPRHTPVPAPLADRTRQAGEVAGGGPFGGADGFRDRTMHPEETHAVLQVGTSFAGRGTGCAAPPTGVKKSCGAA
ncbi:hypothetical protein [Streptomyces sp. NPDC056628]|uniref:hypothetical protein n=1 Tax=Streptomyces sp. NPDC056628 TaxID=3345882 RepID=UPI0036CA22FA